MPQPKENTQLNFEAKAMCPICDCTDIRMLYYTKDMLYGIGGLYKIARCTHCSTDFLDPYPTVEFLNSLYPPENYYSFQQRKINGLIRSIRRKTRRLFPVFTSSEATICDVGCGDGEFLDFAKRAGFQTFGVEQDGQARVLNARTSHQIFSQISDHQRTFDYIRSNHALEHVHDIKSIISEMKTHLAPGGTILIGVPNAQGVLAELFGKYWFYRGAPIHTMGLNEKSFEILCDKFDLKITKVVKRQTFRGTIGSVIIAVQNLFLGKSKEPSNVTFLLLLPLIIAASPFNLLLSLLQMGDLLELHIKHK